MTSTTFLRKTKRGNLVKVVLENYLRDDLPCGVPHCRFCVKIHEEEDEEEEQDASQLKFLNTKRKILLPDTNILLHQLDLLSHPKIENILLLQTTLNEVKHKSMAIYGRVRNLLEQKENCFVFCNENHRETFIKRLEGETQNDRNDKAIRRAAEWYNAHLNMNDSNGAGEGVIFITDDRDCRNKALAEGLDAQSLRTFVEALIKADGGDSEMGDLMDLIAIRDEDDLSLEQRFSYPEHLSNTQISAGLKSGAFYQGVLNISTHNFLEGSVVIKKDGEERTIALIGRESLNRGVCGDVVAIQILPKSEWITATSTIVEEEELKVVPTNESNDDEEETEEKEVDIAMEGDASVEELIPSGIVIGIIKRNWRPFCGTIEAASVQKTSTMTTLQSVFFWSMDKRIPKIRIRTRQAQNLIGKRIIVAIDGWEKGSRYPAGHFVRELGEVGDRQTETQVLLLEHDVPFAPFSAQVLSFLPPQGENWLVSESDKYKREDFRGWDVCSIDPPGCTDIDDALHARKMENGNYEVGVHIADVSHFVKPGNAMDDEGQRRGTTVYLVDKRIDMLPSLLGTNLCSLRSNVDRLSFSCIWEITPDAKILSCRYTKSIIRSKNSFTYDEAQARLDDPKMVDPVSMGIKALNMLAKQLRKRRMEGGALTLASPEVRFRLENGESQDPVDVELKELKDTNALVEEFMLLANVYVAKKIQATFPESSLLRRHPKPPSNNFETLIKALAPMGIAIDATNSTTLSQSLDKAILPSDPYFNKLIRIMTTRCMMQAVYFCSGTLAESEFWHYGLACPIYTHFTSPIRRYSDLQVHRLLSACIGYDEVYSAELTDKVKVDEMSTILNYRHRMAQQAARSSVELYTHLFFKGKTLKEEAYVIRVLKNGLVVLVPKYGVEGIVYSSPSSDPSATPLFLHDAQNNKLVSVHDPSVEITLFQKVVVEITVSEAGDAAAQRSKLQLRLLDPPMIGATTGGGVANAVEKGKGKGMGKGRETTTTSIPAKRGKEVDSSATSSSSFSSKKARK